MGGTRGGDKRGMAEKWLQIPHDLNVYGPQQCTRGEDIMRGKEKQRVSSSQMSKA